MFSSRPPTRNRPSRMAAGMAASIASRSTRRFTEPSTAAAPNCNSPTSMAASTSARPAPPAEERKGSFLARSLGYLTRTRTYANEGAPMKFALALAILTLHCQTFSLAQTYTPAASDESWSNAIQAAASLGQRGEFRQALQSYERLLSMPRITSNIERRAYVPSRKADTEIELGEYPQAEAQAREASTALVSTGLTHTITFAMSQDTLADALRVKVTTGRPNPQPSAP